ncbi:hypothetical protein FRB98_001894 [Tulasnella sp. 332]|nr:hypothetical protein FRB98_001894 [Tulasnella sp. 332]
MSGNTPTTQPHAALAVPEVLLEILENLSSEDLFNMAQTCKDWTGPALETRWKTGRIKLSRLLSVLVPLAEIVDGAKPMTGDRQAHLEEKYASKVKWLELDITLNWNVLDTIEELQRSYGRPICRQLSRLDINPNFGSDWHVTPGSHSQLYTTLLDIVVTPELKEVTTNYITTEITSMLSCRAPHIRHLTVCSESFNCSNFTSLKSFTYKGDLSTVDFITLASLPSLGILDVSWERDIEVHEAPDITAFTFPALYHLSVTKCPADFEVTFMKAIIPALRILHFTVHAPIAVLLHILKTSPLLEDLYIRVRGSPKALKLPRHEKIQRLVLMSSGGDMEGDWDPVGGPFPDLRDLTLCHNGADLLTTWHIFASLGTKSGCQLQRLNIHHRVHISGFPPSQTGPKHTPLSSLKVLNFRWLEIQKEDIDPFTRYLTMLCPNLEKLEIGDFFELFVMGSPVQGRATKQNRRSRQVMVLPADNTVLIRKFFEFQASRRAIEDTISTGTGGTLP